MKSPLLILAVSFSVTAPLYAIPVAVSVVDENGAPIEKAAVQLESFSTSPRAFTLHETAADGTISLEIEPSKQFPDFLGRVVVLKSDYALSGGSLTAKAPLKITLKKGGALRGVVTDGTKRPIKGATIRLERIDSKDKGDNPNLYSGPLQEKMTAISDENGAWQLSNLPLTARTFVSVVAPVFARESVAGQVGETIQTTLQAGASIRGKVVGLEGQPLGGVEVFSQPLNRGSIRGHAQSKTQPDGTFELDGLETGSVNLMFTAEQGAKYVVPALEGVTVTAGEIKTLPEARAVEGILIGGKITEKGSATPIEGASVGVYGALNPASSASVSNATSDKDGLWKLRTLPGKSKVYVMGTPVGFVRQQQTKNLEIGEQGDLNLNFELERAPKLTGRLVDETGKGVAATISVMQSYDLWMIVGDETGNFELLGPKAGEVELGVSRWNPSNESQSKWDVVGDSKRTFVAGTPLEIKVTKAKLSRFEARVYDDQDAALEGAKINVLVWNGTGQNMTGQTRELVSDKEGLVKIEGLRASQKVEIQKAEKEGYDLISKFSVEQQEGFSRAADIVLQKRGGKVSGQVFDSKGAVAVGAKVFSGGLETLTDQNGRFTLEPLPNGKNDVSAVQGDEFAFVSADKEARLELKQLTLQGVDKAQALQIVNEIKEQAKTTRYRRKDSLDLYSGGSFQEIADKVKEKPTLASIYSVIERFSGDQSIELSQWIPFLLSDPKASNRLYASAMLASKREKIQDDETTRTWIDSIKNDTEQIIQQNDGSERWMTSLGVFAVAMVADKIGDTEAADLAFANATAYIAKNFGDKSVQGSQSREEVYRALGEFFGYSPRLFTKLLEQVSPTSNSYSRILGDGIPVLARYVGLESAKPFIDKLKNAPQPAPDERGRTMSVESTYFESVVAAIEAGGQQKPQLALELAQSVPKSTNMGNYDLRDKAMAIAASFDEKTRREPILRESLLRLESSAALKIVADIATIDEKLARELYEVTRQQLDSQPLRDPYEGVYMMERNTPAFAFYESKFNIAQSRYRLEKEFVKAKTSPNRNYYLGEYVRAMSVLDATRALEWANTLQNGVNEFSQFEAKRAIAQWLSADEKTRARAKFSAHYSREWIF